ncbi:hypothetical protein ES708_00049 [subsurface metagenome]
MKIRPFVYLLGCAVHLGFYFEWLDKYLGEYRLGIAVGPLTFGLNLITRNWGSKVIHGDRKGWKEV